MRLTLRSIICLIIIPDLTAHVLKLPSPVLGTSTINVSRFTIFCSYSSLLRIALSFSNLFRTPCNCGCTVGREFTWLCCAGLRCAFSGRAAHLICSARCPTFRCKCWELLQDEAGREAPSSWSETSDLVSIIEFNVSLNPPPPNTASS